MRMPTFPNGPKSHLVLDRDQACESGRRGSQPRGFHENLQENP
jgi:hypothetical protein